MKYYDSNKNYTFALTHSKWSKKDEKHPYGRTRVNMQTRTQ